MKGIEAYPLSWPAGVPRTKNRESSRFHTTTRQHSPTNPDFSWKRKADLTLARTRDELLVEIQRLGGTQVVLSTNVELRNDGLPYSNRRKPDDPGAAVYFQRKGKPMAFACDKWDDVPDNLRAITKTIEALRGIERWGASDMVERAFSGFQALPSAPQKRNWWDVLKVGSNERDIDKIANKRNQLAFDNHPDRGGSNERMAEINAAYAEAVYHLGAT